MFKKILLVMLAVPSVALAALPDAAAFGVRMEVGDVAAARMWLAEGLDPDFEGDRIGTGLMIGAWEGNIPLMEAFVAAGADVNAKNRLGERAIMHAAWKGRREAVEWLLARGASPNVPEMSWGPLAYAVFAGHGEVAGVLMGAGADVNARAPNGASVLMMAAREGREGMVSELLGRGARTDVRSDRNEGVLEWAMRNNNLRIARMVSSKEEFAVAAARPASSWGGPERSEPMPVRAVEIERKARVARAEGRADEAGRAESELLALLRELSKAKPMAARLTAAVPSGVVITADRKDPSRQSVILSNGAERFARDPFANGTGSKVRPD